MATVNLGRIKPVFRGAYSGSTAYVVDDIVTHGNESFICIQAHGAGTQATSQTAYWSKLAAKGTDGTDVGTTITTQGDILYRDGSGLQRLAKGTASQLLRMNSSANAPEWATVAGGAFGQFVFAEDDTDYSNTNQSNYVRATNTKILITPSSASATIFVCFNFGIRSIHSDSSFEHRIIRSIGGTETTIRQSTGSFRYQYHGASSGGNWYTHNPLFLTDTPNTTSQVTYTVEFKNPHRSDAIYLNNGLKTQMMAYELN